jgi:hypothetical protein
MSETGTIKVTAADVKQMLTLRVKVSKLIAPRMKLCVKIIEFAGWVGGVGVEVIEGDDAEPTAVSIEIANENERR